MLENGLPVGSMHSNVSIVSTSALLPRPGRLVGRNVVECESTLKLTKFIVLRKQIERSDPETLSYLLMYYHSTFIWFSTRLNPAQKVFDKLTPHFEETVRHAEIYIKSKAVERPTFTIEVGAVPMLFITAITCRIPSLRRRALDLMSRAPRKECIFGAYSTAEVACRLIEVEEEGLGHPAPDLTGRCALVTVDDTKLPREEKRVHPHWELRRSKTSPSYEIRITRYSEVDGRFKRNDEIVPL